MRRTYKFRIYPNKTQAAQLERVLDMACHVYNEIVHTAQMWYEDGQKWNRFDTGKFWLVERNANPCIRDWLPADSVADLVTRYDQSLKSFWALHKKGHADARPPSHIPRRKFKSVGYRFGKGIKLIPERSGVSRLRLWGVDGLIRVHQHRAIEGEWQAKHFFVTQDRDQWYLSVSLEYKDAPEPQPHPGPAVGIDMGLCYLLALSDGNAFENPRWYDNTQARRAGYGRRIDRMRRANNPQNYNENGTVKDGVFIWYKSNRERKAQRIAMRVDRKIRNQRIDYWHKATDWLTKTYSLIVLEDLTLDFMLKNRPLARIAHDANLGRFRLMLEYKASERGVQVVYVPPAYTSQGCSECGYVDKNNRQTQAAFKCLACGHSENADINAAKNILSRGLYMLENTA